VARGDGDDELVGLVIGQGEPVPIDAIEGDDRREGEPFVAVNEGVIPGQ